MSQSTGRRPSKQPSKDSGAGYSGPPLARKLGIKPGFRILIRGAPDGYTDLLQPLPPKVTVSTRLRAPVDMVHGFTRSKRELSDWLMRYRDTIRADGMIWISWPKQSSGLSTEVNGNTIREMALPTGLVDIKVCAVDGTWSALKLVIRKALRGDHG